MGTLVLCTIMHMLALNAADCTCTHAHTHTHTHTHTQTNTHVHSSHTHTHTHSHTFTHTHTHTHTFTHTHTHSHTHALAHTHTQMQPCAQARAYTSTPSQAGSTAHSVSAGGSIVQTLCLLHALLYRGMQHVVIHIHMHVRTHRQHCVLSISRRLHGTPQCSCHAADTHLPAFPVFPSHHPPRLCR